jgi:hypothetical protein
VYVLIELGYNWIMMNHSFAKLVASVLALTSVAFPVTVAYLNGNLDSGEKAHTVIEAAHGAVDEIGSMESTLTTVKPSEGIVDLPVTVILVHRGAIAARTMTECSARQEGTRDLVQGSGTVRTWTFCSK